MKRARSQRFSRPDAAVAAARRRSSRATARRPGRRRRSARRPPAPCHDLVAGHERQLRVGQLAVDDVQVGAADAAGAHLEEHLARRPARGSGSSLVPSGSPAPWSTIARIGTLRRLAPVTAARPSSTPPGCASASATGRAAWSWTAASGWASRAPGGPPGWPGHIPGAAFLDLDTRPRRRAGRAGPPPAAGAGATSRPRPGGPASGAASPVVAYDEAGEGGAARLWWLLRHFGHDDVAVLDGGLAAWREEGGRCEPGPEPTRTRATSRRGPARATWWTRTRSRPPAPLLLDARAPERYRGETRADRPRGRPHPGGGERALRGARPRGPLPGRPPRGAGGRRGGPAPSPSPTAARA